MTADALQEIINSAWEDRDRVSAATTGAVPDAVEAALDGLDTGSLRVAEKRDGSWVVNQWLKKAVLLGAKAHRLQVGAVVHRAVADGPRAAGGRHPGASGEGDPAGFSCFAPAGEPLLALRVRSVDGSAPS